MINGGEERAKKRFYVGEERKVQWDENSVQPRESGKWIITWGVWWVGPRNHNTA